GGNHITYSNGIIYKTTNAGINWTLQSNSQFALYAMYFIDEQNGYAAGRPDSVFKTTNGGINWKSYYAGTYGFVKSIYFFDVNTGFCGASVGKLYKTYNGGLNWIFDTLGNGIIYSVQFANSQTGFAASNNSPYLYKSTNSGFNWIPVYLSFLTFNLQKIFFCDVNTGYILGGSRLIKTTDCGITWGYQETITNELMCIDFINNNTGFIGGSYGKLLKTSNGGGNFVGIINKQSEIIPEHFSLSQNYPNPFNTTTNIKFDLPKSGFVKITVYDLLGREVTQLLNQQLQAGSYNVDWDGSNYSSGVYFYKLVVGENTSSGELNYSESKKMILVK